MLDVGISNDENSLFTSNYENDSSTSERLNFNNILSSDSNSKDSSKNAQETKITIEENDVDESAKNDTPLLSDYTNTPVSKKRRTDSPSCMITHIEKGNDDDSSKENEDIDLTNIRNKGSNYAQENYSLSKDKNDEIPSIISKSNGIVKPKFRIQSKKR